MSMVGNSSLWTTETCEHLQTNYVLQLSFLRLQSSISVPCTWPSTPLLRIPHEGGTSSVAYFKEETGNRIRKQELETEEVETNGNVAFQVK